MGTASSKGSQEPGSEGKTPSPGDPVGAGTSGEGKTPHRDTGSSGGLLDVLSRGQGTLHIVMLGLDSSGKSTALYRLKFDQYLNTVPTIGFNCERIKGVTGKAKVSDIKEVASYASSD